MKVIYSYNKRGFEAEMFHEAISAASDSGCTWIPFNHDPYVDTSLYPRAQLLDNLYYREEPGLMRLYADMEAMIGDSGADALLVDNAFPYHPEFLRKLKIFKVIRTTDGPLAAYDRDFAYVHAYDQVLFHSPAYSRDLDMADKLRYVGAKDVRFWPLAVFDRMFDTTKTDETILAHERDVDVVFVGVPHPNKMPLLAKVKKAFGRRAVIRGLTPWKWNVYYNAKYRAPGWMRPLKFEEYVPLYQRAKIGFNVHNRGDYTVGSYRLFELPANGVMQISDGGRFLSSFFNVGEEIVAYRQADDLIDKIRYYLAHDDERQRIALAGFRKVMRDGRSKSRMKDGAALIADGIRLKRERLVMGAT
jgi:spore maturation protein CgeB